MYRSRDWPEEGKQILDQAKTSLIFEICKDLSDPAHFVSMRLSLVNEDPEHLQLSVTVTSQDPQFAGTSKYIVTRDKVTKAP